MNNVYIKVEDLGCVLYDRDVYFIKKRYNKDILSIEDVLNVITDYSFTIKNLEEELDRYRHPENYMD